MQKCLNFASKLKFSAKIFVKTTLAEKSGCGVLIKAFLLNFQPIDPAFQKSVYS